MPIKKPGPDLTVLPGGAGDIGDNKGTDRGAANPTLARGIANIHLQAPTNGLFRTRDNGITWHALEQDDSGEFQDVREATPAEVAALRLKYRERTLGAVPDILNPDTDLNPT